LPITIKRNANASLGDSERGARVLHFTALGAAGFEHCVANMYFIPMGLFIKAGMDGKFFLDIGKTAADYANLTRSKFFVVNLLPVTIGNIIGGVGLVSLAYWFIYLRPSWPGRSS
jgi:formate/nitrite transporter FocA (FNT family)